jgi:hypothetical protein
MTHSTYPTIGVPVIRAVRYPHDIGRDADPDIDIEAVEVTHLTVDQDVRVVGRLPLSAMAHPDEARGFEFDLEPAGACELAKRLAEAVSTVYPDGQTARSIVPWPRPSRTLRHRPRSVTRSNMPASRQTASDVDRVRVVRKIEVASHAR